MFLIPIPANLFVPGRRYFLSIFSGQNAHERSARRWSVLLHVSRPFARPGEIITIDSRNNPYGFPQICLSGFYFCNHVYIIAEFRMLKPPIVVSYVPQNIKIDLKISTIAGIAITTANELSSEPLLILFH